MIVDCMFIHLSVCELLCRQSPMQLCELTFLAGFEEVTDYLAKDTDIIYDSKARTLPSCDGSNKAPRLCVQDASHVKLHRATSDCQNLPKHDPVSRRLM
jgi:hypothetical protein